MTNEFIALLANVALTLSFIVALIFGIAQINASARDRRERLTLETLRSFHTRDFSELISFVNTLKWPKTAKEMSMLPEDDQVRIIQFAQQMESLGLLVAEHYIDMDLVDKTLGAFVTSAWHKYKSVFCDMRERVPDPFLGEYFQWLAERIEERMQQQPREPFYKAFNAAMVKKRRFRR